MFLLLCLVQSQEGEDRMANTTISSELKDVFSGMGDSFKENGAFQGAIDNYLKYNTTPQGITLHWVNIISSAASTHFTKDVNRTRFSGGETYPFDVAINALDPHTSPDVLKFMNDIYNATKDPNIEGIPIKSFHCTTQRDVEVADYGVIMSMGHRHENIADNAVPKPRTWNIEGYLTGKWDMDIGFILKPSLLMQTKILDGFAVSRRPLWFKTDENEFVLAQITYFKSDKSAEVTNACKVSVQLKEFVPLEISESRNAVEQAIFILSH